MEHCRGLVDEWSKVKDRDDKGRLMGLLHSFLVVLDGESQLPAFKLIASPHPSDKDYHKDRGEDWWPPFPEDLEEREDLITVHGGTMLHEMLYQEKPQVKGGS